MLINRCDNTPCQNEEYPGMAQPRTFISVMWVSEEGPKDQSFCSWNCLSDFSADIAQGS